MGQMKQNNISHTITCQMLRKRNIMYHYSTIKFQKLILNLNLNLGYWKSLKYIEFVVMTWFVKGISFLFQFNINGWVCVCFGPSLWTQLLSVVRPTRTITFYVSLFSQCGLITCCVYGCIVIYDHYKARAFK